MKYKFIDSITSDVMFEAYGKDLKELFKNAALALFSVICKIEKVKPNIKKEIEIKSNNLEELMMDWLQELIALVDIEAIFLSKFDIIKISETYLKANVYGESIRPELGETVVKGVTNYGFSLEKTKQGFKVRISLDI